MYLLVHEGQICGKSNSPDNLPNGFSTIAYDGDREPADLELIDGKICEKKPAPVAELPVMEIPVSPWLTLRQRVQNSPIWEASFQASYKSLKAQSAWTLMLSAIESSNDLNTFSFAVCALLDTAPEKFSDDIKADFLEILEEVGLITDDLKESLTGE